MRIIEISFNANLFPVKYLKNRVITIFNFEVCPPPPPGPSFPLTYVVSIFRIQYKGFDGSRGGGGRTFISKNDNDPISVILTGNKFALKRVSLMHTFNTTKSKAGLFQQYILRLVPLQKLQPKQ